MANFELDPLEFAPPGFNIIDGGSLRLSRTFFSPAVAPDRRHEDYAIAIVEPAPLPEEVPIYRNLVSDFIVNNLGRDVLDAQPWIQGVGLFHFRSPATRHTLLAHALFDLGSDRFVRFVPHDEGINYRATHGFHRGWAMILGIPLDYRCTDYIADAISTFGHFHHWHQDDPRLVRTLAYVSFPAPSLVPRDVVYREYANFGGARVSWTAPIYILSAEFVDMITADEDPMPFDGNPHPLPGHMHFDNHTWAMPEFPELGWNEVPPPANNHPHADNDQPGHQEDQHEPVEEVQSQESIVLQVSDDSVNDDVPGDAVIVYQPPVVPAVQPVLHIGQVLTVFGPVLPPVMQWQRSFERLMPMMWVSEVPKSISLPALGPVILAKRSWDICFSETDLMFKLVPQTEIPRNPVRRFSLVRRPVARALCFDVVSEPMSETFAFSATPVVSKKRTRKGSTTKPVIMVDSQVCRSARLSALRDGYRKPQPKMDAPQPLARVAKKCKAKAATPSIPAAPVSGDPDVPPPTTINEIQHIGARLHIDPEKITVEKLVANPSSSSSSKGSDD